MALRAPLSSARVIPALANAMVWARWHGAQSVGDAAKAGLEAMRSKASFICSFHVDSLLLLRLRGGVQLLHDGALAVSLDFELQPVVHRGQRDVRFGKRRSFLHDQLQVTARGVEFVLAYRDGGKLVARAEIAGTHLQCAMQADRRLVEFLVLLQEDRELQIGREVVGIGGERFAKGLGCAHWIAGAQQSLTVKAVQI